MSASAAASPWSGAPCSRRLLVGGARLGTAGRLVIRRSGTEPVIRVMAQGENETLLESVVGDILTIAGVKLDIEDPEAPPRFDPVRAAE